MTKILREQRDSITALQQRSSDAERTYAELTAKRVRAKLAPARGAATQRDGRAGRAASDPSQAAEIHPRRRWASPGICL